MAKKSTRKRAGTTRSAHGKAAKAKATKPGVKGHAAAAEPQDAPSAALARPEVKKIQGLLKSKTADGVTLGLSLLESLGATTADYKAVFTETVIKSVLNGWVADSWGVVAKALVPHGAVSKVFQRLAEERYLKRPRKHSDFGGLLHARMPVAQRAFLATWGQTSHRKKPFVGLVAIRPGSFVMGSPEQEAGRSDNEGQVQVRITKPFRMGRTVITQGQWRAVMGTEPWRELRHYSFVRFGNAFPAVAVTWEDAALFCLTLTKLEHEAGRLPLRQAYRLPTEAEWEYACRAGTTTAYSFGDSPGQIGAGGSVLLGSDGKPRGKLNLHAWFFSNSDGASHEVAQKLPNPWGLFDMHGNVDEWCADWYANVLVGGADPRGPAHGRARVLRGGRWHDFPDRCRSAARTCCPPDRDDSLPGFRVVCGELR